MARTLNETIHLVLGLTEAIAKVQDLDELYEAVGFGSQLVYDLYPHIDCHTGCNRCCKDNSLPIVSPVEWARVYQGVLALPEAAQQELIQRVRAWHDHLGPRIWELHEWLQAPTTTTKLEAIADLLTHFVGTTCPFVVMDRCGIYADRPSKCRAHGAYLIRFGDLVQLHSCAEEVDKMEAYLEQQGSRRIAMPFWNPVEDRLAQLNEPEATSTILALWLTAHFVDGRFVAEADLHPDWEAVRRRWEQAC